MIDRMTTALMALDRLGVRVTRGWPQGLVALPSLVLKEAENQVTADGSVLIALELTVRASSPEEADELAREADRVLDYRRTACKDGAERDGSCFLKHLRYEERLPGIDSAEETMVLTLGGEDWDARVIREERRRELIDLTTLADAGPRLLPGRFTRHTLQLALPGYAEDDFLAAFLAGDKVLLPGGAQALVEGLTQRGPALEVTLHETL